MTWARLKCSRRGTTTATRREAPPKPDLYRAARRKAPRPFVISGSASPTGFNPLPKDRGSRPRTDRDLARGFDHNRLAGGAGAFDGREPSTLTLLRDLQTLHSDYLRQPLSDLPRSEQRDAFRSEPFLGDPHQLLERVIPGLTK